VDAASSGDVVQVLGEFHARATGTAGTSVSDRGRRLEIWRRQADGTWKCAVDSWMSEGTAPAGPEGSMPAVPTPAVPTPAVVAAPVRSPAPPPMTKYGDPPVNYQPTIRQYFQEHLLDPASIQFQEVTNPVQGSISGISTGFLMHETHDFGWIVKATINARNSHGSYVGFKTYQFLFRGEQLIRATAPPPAGEMVN
jgi:hypothetical protein